MSERKSLNKVISVIIPTYNSENTIIKSINSVLKQKINNFIEIIIIDDNSVDKTVKKIKGIRKKNNFEIKIIKNKINKGSGYCRRIGIKNAKGFYLAFLDSDDYWLNNKLSDQIKFINNNPSIKFTYSDYLKEYSYKNKLHFYQIKTPIKISINENKYINNIPNSSVLINSDLVKKIKYPKQRLRNDFIFWNKILSKNKKKIKAYNFNPGKPYFVYGLNQGISSNKCKIIFNQWLLYRKIFKYSYIRSIYGIILNIKKFLNRYLVRIKSKNKN